MANRLEGFDLLCEMMQEIYPFFDLKGIDWPALRAKYRAQVAAAPDPQTYAACLGEMLAALKDDHTRIESEVGNVYAPGLWLRAFSNRLFVTSVDKTSDAYKEGFTPGMEILAVDGMSLERAAETVAERFFHYIPPRDGPMYRAIYSNLLAGPLNSTVSVETRADGGLPHAVMLKRSRGITQPPNAEAPAHEADAGQEGFGYIKLSGFSERANAVQEFDQFLDAHKTAKGLILDLRGNGGGTALVSDPILGRLIERRVCAELGYWRASAPGPPWGMRSLLHCAQPRGPWQYFGPVVILVDRDTYSAAESFLLMLKSGRRVVLIGETTGGGASNLMGYSLPGMIRLWFSTLDAKLREGESLESRGIDPDIPIASTIDTYRSNAALLRAIEYLKTVPRPEGNLLTHRPTTDGTWAGAWDGWITQSKSISFPFSLQIEEHGGPLRVEAPFSYLVTSVQTSQDSIKLDLAIPLVSLNLKGTIKGDHIQGSWSSRDFPYLRGRWHLDRYR
jgi:carboxyl-terminal processing protease